MFESKLHQKMRRNSKVWRELGDYSLLEEQEREKGLYDRWASFWRASKWTKLFCSFFIHIYISVFLFAERMCVRKSKSINWYQSINFAFCLLHRCLATTSTIYVSTFLFRASERCLQLASHINICLFIFWVNVSCGLSAVTGSDPIQVFASIGLFIFGPA